MTHLPDDSKARKDIPLYSGVLKYFPKALAAIAEHSRIGNEKHNPGEPLHWSRDKSNDHLDCAARHLLEADDVEHATALAWRALAHLEITLEAKQKP